MAASKKLSAVDAAQAFENLARELHAGELAVCIRGSAPLIFNAVSLKAKQELLFPRTRTRAQRAMTLKHDPLAEYRNSVYRRRAVDTGPTRLIFPCPAFKGVIREAALDLPADVTKAKIGRLTWVEGDKLDIYGVPQLLMSVVRNSDIGRTPDIRTRAILPQWACRFTLRFISPILNARILDALIQMGGLTIGIGDFRQEKGKGSYGQFEPCSPDDAAFQAIVETGGMAAQDEALRAPDFYDAETEELYAWFSDEIQRRGQEDMRNGEDDDEDDDNHQFGFGNGEDLQPPA